MKKIVLVLVLLAAAVNISWSRGEVQRIYEPPMSAADQRILNEIKQSGVVSEIIRLMNNEFTLTDNLTIRIGAPKGPLFDNQYGEIAIPYSFITITRNVFTTAWPGKSPEQVNDATMDVLMHVLLHEMGHALLDLFDIPAIRNEENEVDDLAAILLVEMFEDGDKIVLNAARAFDLQKTRYGAYAREHRGTEHGLSEERFRNMACLVYGSDPKKYPDLLQNTGLTADDAVECEHRYKIRRDYWLDTLGPNMKNESAWNKSPNAKKSFWKSLFSRFSGNSGDAGE